jgi:hypothetical protein
MSEYTPHRVRERIRDSRQLVMRAREISEGTRRIIARARHGLEQHRSSIKLSRSQCMLESGWSSTPRPNAFVLNSADQALRPNPSNSLTMSR